MIGCRRWDDLKNRRMVDDSYHVLDVKDHDFLWQVYRKHALFWMSVVEHMHKRTFFSKSPAAPLFDCYLRVEQRVKRKQVSSTPNIHRILYPVIWNG